MLADHALNRRSWDQLAEIHGQDAYYDAEALCAGKSSLIAEEEAALELVFRGGLIDKRILHLQCHLGFDAITFARRGASVTGVDFSRVALERAAGFASACGVSVDWVCADVLELPDSMNASFDLVWATLGVLCWIADLPGWMRVVSNALVPGGKLVLIDGVANDPAPESGASESPTGRRFVDSGWDYATPFRTGSQVQFQHSRGNVVAAAQRSGLRINHLEEHASISTHLCIKGLLRGSDGRYRNPDARPVLFTLVAERVLPSNACAVAE